MKTLFDSSVLIAFCVRQHPKHALAKQWLSKENLPKNENFISSHSLLEAYSVLTRAPFEPKIGALDAKLMLDKNIISRLSLISLRKENYLDVLDLLATHNLTGGVTYDAGILACAKQENIQRIVTANAKDFSRLTKAFSFEIEIAGI